jgi:peptidoglycan/LPS O-acetylase OafA/YrhL
VKHDGAYDCIRLLAAAMVLLSHSYILAGDANAEPLARLTGGAHDLGEIAVNLFFAMSGYLVALSWQRDPDFRRFLLRRALRIVPGLAAVVLGSALAIGPIFTSLDLASYFAAPRTWLYLTKITAMPALHALPGVFDGAPYPAVVNGSLWSLRLEVLCYFGLALLGLLAWKRATPLLAAAIMLLAAADQAAALPSFGLWPQMQPFAQAYLINAMIFLIGILVARLGLPARPLLLGLPAAAATLALMWRPEARAPFAVALALAAIGCGAGLRCSVKSFGDWSYGLYLWAFPVQQMTVTLWPGLSPLGLFARALPATLLLAALSWHLIEKRMLAYKPKRVVKPG